jgi:ubiquinone/menaquinone biosynthesis C-methylase UbiE
MRGLEQIPLLYDAVMAIGDWTGLGTWRRWLTGDARGRTLEVGCGTGRNLPLYPTTVSVVALDPAFDSLLRARRRAPHLPLVQASAEALPFRDGAFETVVSGLVFCSVPDPGKGLSEVRRVLHSSGQLRMIEHVRHADGTLGGRWQDFIQPAWTRVSGGCHNNRHTERNVEQAGFVIEGEGRRAEGTMRRFSARKTSTLE